MQTHKPKRNFSRLPPIPRVFSQHLVAPAGTESIGYDVNESSQHVDYFERVGLFSTKFTQSMWLTFGAFRWILLLIIGVGAGTVAVGVELALHFLMECKLNLTDWVGQASESLGLQYGALMMFSLCCSAVAGVLVCFVEVLAAGSGIPEIKCYLNGIHLPKLVTGRTLFAKAVGIVFSVSAGLPCGKEGPMIHSGAIVGAMVSHLNLERRLRPLNLDVEMRDFVAAGAAAGVSAAFGAPVGAVLFAVEEGASHMTPRILTQLFVSSSVASLITRLTLGPILEKHTVGLLGTSVPVSFGRFKEISYHFVEMFIFALMGVAAGLLGAMFNHFNRSITKWRKRHVGPRGCTRFLEVLCVTLAIATMKFWMPVFVRAWDAKHWEPVVHEDLTVTQRLWFDGGQTSMISLFHEQHAFDEIWLLLLFGIFNLITTCWTFGLGVPAGLFVPSLLTGAVLGRWVGEVLNRTPEWLIPETWAHPSLYALVGASAMLAGVGRITISLAMILTEATGAGNFALPILMVVVIATWTGNQFNRGIYDLHIIELKQIPLLEQTPADVMVRYYVKDIMSKKVVRLEAVEKVGTVLDVLSSCNHNGFPVVDIGTQKLEGIIERGYLHLLLSRGNYYSMFQDDRDANTGQSIVPFEAIAWPNIHSYPSVSELKRRLSSKNLEMWIDLRPYVNANGYSIPPHASMASAFSLFRRLGLRHLPVVDRHGDLCGILTRKDLILVEENEVTGELVQRSQPALVSDTGWAYRKSEAHDLESGTSAEDLGIDSMLESETDGSDAFVEGVSNGHAESSESEERTDTPQGHIACEWTVLPVSVGEFDCSMSQSCLQCHVGLYSLC
ncbi:Clcn7 [Symbiodinium natans]|uniref:Chloride channel protein n=1 Tax=Symbiodinium natans TaxID=878477 RepID=A0A812GW12_9DINO|nr:Clcn7 [Symbiodinium natans]